MAGTMKQMPPAMSPGHPARRKPRWIAISVVAGPGNKFVAPRRSTNCSSLSQRRRRTTSSRIMAMCAAGPPKAIVPSLRKSQATSRIGGRLAGMAEDAKRYHRLQLILGMLGLAVTGAYFVIMLFAGLGPRVARWAGGLSDALVWRVAAVAAAIAIGQALVTFPLAWLRGYWLPRRHGLLHQTLGAWLRDRLKAALIGAALVAGGRRRARRTPGGRRLRVSRVAVAALLSPDATRRRAPVQERRRSRLEGGHSRRRGVGGGPVAQGPYRERGAGRNRPDPSGHPLRHAGRALRPRRGPGGARARARSPRAP